MQFGREDTLEERYTIKFSFKLVKNTTETYGMLQTAFGSSCMNRASVFEWHKIFKECRECVRDDQKCGRSKEVNTPELIGQRVRVRLGVEVLREFRKRFRRKRPALFKSGQWHFYPYNAPVHNSILATDYLTIYVNRGELCILQSSSISGASPSYCLVSYLRHSLKESYPSAELQTVYSMAPADWARLRRSKINIYINEASYRLLIFGSFFLVKWFYATIYQDIFSRKKTSILI